MDRVREILRRIPLIDGHNDLPEQLRGRAKNRLGEIDLAGGTADLDPPMQTDIPRLRRGGAGGVFFAAYVSAGLSGPAAVPVLFEQIDVIRRMAGRYPGDFELAVSADEVERVHGDGRIAALIGIEGGHALGNSLPLLRQAYLAGARYLTLTHLKSNDWADAALWPGIGEETLCHGGLSPFGREVVREMNRLGMLVDLSHTADATMLAALEVSEAPVIFSHAGARAVCDHPRNVPDDILRRMAANGGIVMADFIPGYTSDDRVAWDRPALAEYLRLERLHPEDAAGVAAAFKAWKARNPPPRVTLSQVADHLDHLRRVAGIDHVGLGSDFDGSLDGEFPTGLEDVSRTPALLAEMLRRGYSVEEAGKVAGGNLLRVMRRAEETARRLQRRRAPSEACNEDRDRAAPPPAPPGGS